MEYYLLSVMEDKLLNKKHTSIFMIEIILYLFVLKVKLYDIRLDEDFVEYNQ